MSTRYSQVVTWLTPPWGPTGSVGRIESSEVALHLANSSRGGHAVIDRELYVPRSWVTDAVRCRSAGIPEDVGLATKPRWPPYDRPDPGSRDPCSQGGRR
ncbi:transposase [Streptomyces canus]|uniref:transposase n=1 Tax=Streptomyces canus TaxID=58343 RepID=UPI0036AE1E0D